MVNQAKPMTSLNPVITIGEQIAESIMLHQKLSRKQAMKLAVNITLMEFCPLQYVAYILII